MSQTFSGTMLLGIIVLFIIVLFVLGLVIKPKLNQSNGHKNKKTKANAAAKSKTGKSKKSPKAAPSKFKSPVGEFKPSNSQLVTLKKRVTKLFPELNATVKERHLVLERDAQKVAMLTVDQKAALGRRKLGNVEVINFHNLPDNEELKIELSGI